MFRKILVAAGPNAEADHGAVARAAWLAQRAGAAVELFAAVYEPALQGYMGHTEVYGSLRERVVGERESRLEALAGELRAQGLRCEAKAVWSHPAHLAVAREVAADEVDLVVVEPPRDGRLSHEDWRLISTCPAPVLVCRRTQAEPYDAVVAAVDPAHSHGKPAELDLAILRTADSLRALCDARLDAVHCFPPLAGFIADSAVDDALRSAERSLRDIRRDELTALLAEAGLPAEAGRLIDGRPAEALTARSGGAANDLLVLGVVSRSAIRSLFIGSTAERVLRSRGGDVLVLKPPGFGLTAPGRGADPDEEPPPGEAPEEA